MMMVTLTNMYCVLLLFFFFPFYPMWWEDNQVRPWHYLYIYTKEKKNRLFKRNIQHNVCYIHTYIECTVSIKRSFIDPFTNFNLNLKHVGVATVSSSLHIPLLLLLSDIFSFHVLENKYRDKKIKNTKKKK